VSETAPEPTGGPPKARGKLGIWAKKYGPLPAWAWVSIGLVIVLGVLYLRSRNSTASNAASTSSDTTAADSTGAGQIPQFVNQTYTTVQPPSAPSPPPSVSTTPPVGNQIPGHTTVTANGSETLAQIASKYGTTPADIVAFTKAHKVHQSPTETKFFSKPTGKVPKGIILWVPEKQVTNVTGPGSGTAPTS